jgi:hypothetical protein
MLLIECSCGRRFECPANQRIIRCSCGRKADALKVKDRGFFIVVPTKRKQNGKEAK